MRQPIAMMDGFATDPIEVIGRHPDASNAAFVVSVGGVRAMYKPVQGERELWDFPVGTLAMREVAAFAVAEALGIHCIPETIWREDAPFGPGSLQRWIEPASVEDVDVVPSAPPGWHAVLDARLQDGTDVQLVHRDDADLRALALLDAVLNNADRKGGHILRDEQGRLWAVDHGVTLHAEPKLRTVLWGFIDDPIDEALLSRLDQDWSALPAVMQALHAAELDALHDRCALLSSTGRFPPPSPDWPAIPWPVF